MVFVLSYRSSFQKKIASYQKKIASYFQITTSDFSRQFVKLFIKQSTREMGLESADFDNRIALYGFDGNYPRGHVDFPPHFHFFIAWSDFGKSRVTHFDLDDEGRITHNRFHCGVTRTNRIYEKGEVCTQYSPDEKLSFEMMVTYEGGLMVRKPEGEQEYFLKPDSETGHLYEAVEVYRGGDER